MITLSDFYRSKEWCKLLVTLKLERVNESGELICEYCGKPIVKAYDCIGHHVEELTEENYRDANVSLNPDNIKLIHHKCHNIIHNKLQHSRRSIYIVYGSPLAGKRKYVNDVANEGDLIVDIDRVWSCVGVGGKSGRLNAVVFGVRDYLLDCIKYRRGKWLNAYVIGGYPLISERERLAKELGAELIYINATKEECLNRLMSREDLDVKEYTEFIETWWSKYSPPTLN